MGANYLASSLPAPVFNAPAPLPAEEFLARCRAQLGAADADGIAAVMASFAFAAPGPGAVHPLTRRWTDLETQLRNAVAAERARALGADPAKYRRPAAGCSLYWTSRAAAAFQETDPMRRETLLDRVWWDAAEELTPPGSPLSLGALFTYAVRLAVCLKRQRFSVDGGNAVFDRLTQGTSSGEPRT